MIARANLEIRQSEATAERLRRNRIRTQQPFAYLDWLISQLEELNLRGHKRVPRRWASNLDALAGILPPEVPPPAVWCGTIRGVIDQCFDVQEQLLRG